MVRITSATASHKRIKRLKKRAKGFWGDRKNHKRLTQGAVMKAKQYNYTHRKHKKRDFRKLWITRLAAAAKINGISYSKMICGLKKLGCDLNRKMLSDLAIKNPKSFAQVLDQTKAALA